MARCTRPCCAEETKRCPYGMCELPVGHRGYCFREADVIAADPVAIVNSADDAESLSEKGKANG